MAGMQDPSADSAPIICHRCGAQLTAGKGSFYVVRIEAYADPTPAPITAEDLSRDVASEWSGLMEQLRGASSQEMMDQVYRRLVMFLCRPCYDAWIENPAG